MIRACIVLCGSACLAALGACTSSPSPVPPSSRAPSYLYVWASDADSAHSDFLAVINATPGHARYGEVVATIPVGATRTMAHHTEPRMPADGVLHANGFHANTTFRIDLREPLRPRLMTPLPVPSPFSHAHSFERLPNGGILATYQYQGGGMDLPGGLVEYDAGGRVVRTSSAVHAENSSFVRPYSLAISPLLDRVITTGNDMHHSSVSTVVQVWRLSDLALLHTVALPAGPRGDEHVNSYEPRFMADGRTALVVTRNCGLYHLRGFDTGQPTAALVYTFDDTRCFVPVVIGRYWLQPLANQYAIAVFDAADPLRPREVSRLELGPENTPHWLATDGEGKRIVITGFRGLERRVLVATFDSTRGVLTLDTQFRSGGSAAPGVSFDRDRWPHGRTGPAVPHGAVFSLSRAGGHASGAARMAVDTPPPNPVPANARSRSALLARAAALELDTPYDPPPGVALHHHTAGFANMLCAAVFLTGLDPRDAAANVGGFTSPFAERRHVVDTIVDFQNQRVTLRLADGTVRTARRYRSQGCVVLGIGEDSVHFTPSTVVPRLPPAEVTPWPMGDLLAAEPTPAGIDPAAIEAALDRGFGPPEAMTLGLVVTHNGRILGERYAEGIGLQTPLESWSMTKSLTGTLVAVLIEQGAYDLWQRAPIPEWQSPGDPRAAIRIGDILRMSSGLRIRAPQDPDYDPAAGYPDHLYLYTSTANAFHRAATRPLQWPPNTVGRYRNTDPVLASYLVRLAVERRGEDYHAFPQRALFDRLGIRSAVLMTDPYGNFLGQGMAFMSARDWARLGYLYLQDGVWNGERILPDGYVAYATTPAPAWVADGRPVYGGGFLWVNGDGGWPLPRSAYGFRGAGGQSTTVVPTHGLVIVRLGKYAGAGPGARALEAMFEMLMQVIPPLAP